MIGTIVMIATGIVILFGHWKARQYTRSRLRFVEVVQSPLAPVIAGVGAAIVAAPIVWLLPFVGTFSALLFGVGVGTGVMLGAKDVKRLPSG